MKNSKITVRPAVTQALILCAGQGTRLGPLTSQRPKPMLPIAGKPLLEHTVCWLQAYGVTDIAINLHYRPEVITRHFGSGSHLGVKLAYSHELAALGTSGAIKKLEGFFRGTFLVVYGDILTDLSLTHLFHRHFSSHSEVTLSLYRVPNPTECGIVELAETGRVVRMVEKPPAHDVFSDLASAGVMVMERDVLSAIPRDSFHDIGYDLIPRLLDGGRPLQGVPISDDEYLMDIGTPAKYRQACADWLARGRRPEIGVPA